MHEELIYQMCVTEDEDEAYQIMLLVIEQYLAKYATAREEFANINEFTLEGYSDIDVRNEYSLYLYGVLVDMRERAREKESSLTSQEVAGVALVAALRRSIMLDYAVIDATERGNAIQMGQLDAITALQDQRGDVRILKEWVAHPDCCEVCKRLNGTILPIEAPFLVDGQIVELEGGKEFKYNYIDRLIAIAHPNDRCHVEFIIEY